MSYTDRVRAAHNPQDALCVIAEALDALVVQQQAPDPWGNWGSARTEWERQRDLMAEGKDPGGVKIQQDDDTTTVTIPPPSPEKVEQRATFEAQTLKLYDSLPPGEDWNIAYVRGGPLWLYHGNRELFMSYPYSVRQQMVADIEEDSPHEAHLIAIDALKHPGETGPGGTGMKMAEGNIG